MRKRYAILLAAAFLLAGCSSQQQEENANYVIDIATMRIPDETEAPTESPYKPAKVSFLAVGDNLIHSCVYQTASAHAANGIAYDFHYCYQYIEDEVAAADVAFINQETLICNGEYELSGSNLNFNSPVELGENLIDIGFDIFNMANNHMLDKGADGLRAAMDYWDSKEKENPNVLAEGAFRNAEDTQCYAITEVNGIKIGVLGYTDHTNGYSLPEESEYVIPYLSDETLMQQQIQELSEQVDCVIVSAHWGEEDSHVVRDSDRGIAQKMIDWGADVIIGTGSHTLETMEYVTRSDGTQGFVFYSLGNFISGQTDNFNLVGGMGAFEICRDGEGNVTIENVTLTPLITHYEYGMSNVRVYPYYLYTDELVSSHYIPYTYSGTRNSWSWEVIDTIIYENVPEEFLRLTE